MKEYIIPVKLPHFTKIKRARIKAKTPREAEDILKKFIQIESEYIQLGKHIKWEE